MSNTLFALATEYRQVAQQLADLDLSPEVVRDTLEGLSGELEVKAQNVALMIRSFEADAAAVKAWAVQAAARAKALEARAEHLREYLSANLQACGTLKVTGPAVSISFRRVTSVEVFDQQQVPVSYWRQKPPPAPEVDKTAIKEAITAGAEVPGARLAERQAMQIK